MAIVDNTEKNYLHEFEELLPSIGIGLLIGFSAGMCVVMVAKVVYECYETNLVLPNHNLDLSN